MMSITQQETGELVNTKQCCYYVIPRGNQSHTLCYVITNYHFPWQPFPGIRSLREIRKKWHSCRQQRVCHSDHRDQQQHGSVTDWRHLRQLHGQHHWCAVGALHHCWQIRQRSVLPSGCSGLDHHAHQPVTISYITLLMLYYCIMTS